MEKVRLTERPENLSSNSEILDWDIYQYYKFLAERGDVQIQVMHTEKTTFLEHANYLLSMPGGSSTLYFECEAGEVPSSLCPTSVLSPCYQQFWGLIQEVVGIVIARWWRCWWWWFCISA